MGKLTDNLRKVYKGTMTLTGITTVSLEIDLQLPRGYVAKIERVRFATRNPVLVAGDLDWSYVTAALVNDPDDATSVTIPDNELHHDVIADFLQHHFQDITANFVFINEYGKVWDFKAIDMDVLVARPMRFNADTDDAAFDNPITCTIEYSLEKVTSNELLKLLDIL